MITKLGAGWLAIVLSLVGYIPYIRDIFRGKTRPHAYSWLIWTILSFTVFFAQLSRGAGLGAYLNVVTGFVSAFIVICAFRQGDNEFTPSDKFALVAGLTAIPLWIITKDPFWSIVVVTIIDIIAFWPTIRKSWHKPRSETVSSFVIAGTKYGLGVIALAHYNRTTVLYPATLVLVNAAFVALVLARRKRVKA